MLKRLLGFLGSALMGLFISASSGTANTTADFDELLNTKRRLFQQANEKFHTLDIFRPEKIKTYQSGMADILIQSRQMELMILLGSHSPLEVRRYFKKASGLKRQFAEIAGEAMAHIRRIEANKVMVEKGLLELEGLLQSAPPSRRNEIQALMTEMADFGKTLSAIEDNYAGVFELVQNGENKLTAFHQRVQVNVEKIWIDHLSRPAFGYFNTKVGELIREMSLNWAGSLGGIIRSKLPETYDQWRQSVLAFLLATGLVPLTARLIKVLSKGWDIRLGLGPAYYPGIVLFPGFGAASLACPYPENEIFFQIAMLSGTAGLIFLICRWDGTVSELRFHASPLAPLLYLFVFGIAVEISGMPLHLLAVAWPLGVCAMLIFLYRQIRSAGSARHRKVARVSFWLCLATLGLSLAGFTFLAMEFFFLIFLCVLLFLAALSVSARIQNRLAELQEKGDSVLHLIFISLGTPLVWFLTAGLILAWTADQFGYERLMDWAGRFEFVRKEVHIGGIQILLALILFFIIRAVGQVLKKAAVKLCRRMQMKENAMVPVRTTISYGIWIVYGLILMHIIGVSLSSILVLAGGMSVGIGFGLQHIINNFVSGLILIFGRTVRLGDIVELDRILGEVDNVTILNTMILTRDDTFILVPNSNLVSSPLVNMSRGSRSVRLVVGVGVAYDSDVGLVTQLLEKIALEHPDILSSPAPRVRLENFGASSLDFSIKFWVKYNGSKRVPSELRYAIVECFRKNGIEIAFPQMDLTVKELPV